MKDNTIPSILNNLTYQQQVYVCYRYLTEIDPVIQDIASKIDDIETYIQEEVAKAIETELSDETITQIISEQVTKYMTENPIKYEDISFSTEQDKTALTNNINELLNAINGTTLKDNSIPLSKIIQIESVNPTVILTKENDGSLSYTSIDNNEILGKKDNKVQGLSLNGDILPTYQNGKVLSNNGTSLQWVDQKGGGGGGSGGGIPDDNSVSTQKIQDGAVTEPKLANGAVTSNKILDGAVISNKLGDLSVTTQKIQDDAVTEDKLSQDVLNKLFILPTTDDNGKYLKATGEGTYDWETPSFTLEDNTVSTQKIQDSAVTTSKIEDEAVTRTKLASGAVSNSHLSDLSVSTNKIQNNAVTNEKLNDGSVTINKMRTELQRLLVPTYTNANANRFLMVQQGGSDATLTWSEVGGGGGGGTPSDNSVSTQKIQDGAVTEPKLSNDVSTRLLAHPDYVSYQHAIMTYVDNYNSSGDLQYNGTWSPIRLPSFVPVTLQSYASEMNSGTYQILGEDESSGKFFVPGEVWDYNYSNATVIESATLKYEDGTPAKVIIRDGSLDLWFNNYTDYTFFKPLLMLFKEETYNESDIGYSSIDLSDYFIKYKNNETVLYDRCCPYYYQTTNSPETHFVYKHLIIPKEFAEYITSNEVLLVFGFYAIQ